MPKQIIQFPWPVKGLMEQSSFQSPTPESTLDCLNVRNFDAMERRLRGGKRTGISKYINTQVGSGSFIQHISDTVETVAIHTSGDVATTASNPGTVTTTTTAQQACGIATLPDRAFIADHSGNAYLWSVSGNSYPSQIATQTSNYTKHGVVQIPNTNLVLTMGSYVHALWAVTSNSITVVDTFSTTSVTPSVSFSAYDYSADRTGQWGIGKPGWLFPLSSAGIGVPTQLTVPDGGTIYSAAFAPAADLVCLGSSNNWLYMYQFDPTTGTLGTLLASKNITYTPLGHMALTSDGSYIYANSSGARSHHYDSSAGTISDYIDTAPTTNAYKTGFQITSDDKYLWDGEVMSEISSGVFVQSFSAGTASQASGLVTDTLPVGGGHFYVFTPPTTNPSARKENLLVVSGGNLYRSNDSLDGFATPTNGSSAFQNNVLVSATEAYQKVYFTDGTASGYKVLDLSTNVVNTWSTSAGALPIGSTDTTLGCRFGVLYRGRVVLSGLQEEPQNWFMSKSGDPTNWDYAPSTSTSTQAVAGNNSNAGELGDVLTALAPFQDDILLMGGAKSLWIMRGDPAAGGLIDNVSRQTGIVGQQAWCFDNTGIFYFFGPNGLYRMSPGNSEPELISRGRLDKTFSDIDTAIYNVALVYDNYWQGVHIFQTALSAPSSTVYHYFWDQRTDSFWRDTYPSTIGPSCIHLFQSVQSSKRGVLLGGYDGYLRAFDASAMGDDGTAIESYAQFTPQAPGDILAASRLDDLHLVMGNGSGNTTFKLFTGNTIEDAVSNAQSGSPRFVRSITDGGRSTAMRNRIAQSAFIPLLYQSSVSDTWAFERLEGTQTIMSRMRGKHV